MRMKNDELRKSNMFFIFRGIRTDNKDISVGITELRHACRHRLLSITFLCLPFQSLPEMPFEQKGDHARAEFNAPYNDITTNVYNNSSTFI